MQLIKPQWVLLVHFILPRNSVQSAISMSKFYSDESLAEIASARSKWMLRNQKLMENVLGRTYRTPHAAEYARHGVSRRLRSLGHDSDRVFDLIAPDIDQSPKSEAILDATAFIQSFIMNVYGAIDNFARIWCLEAGVLNKKGKPVADGNIGFRPKNTDVRSSLSGEFQEYLQNCDPWFEYIENYRHAVAHRIPVYIPPKTLKDDEINRYMKLEADGTAALMAGKKADFWKLFREQRELGVFEPLMMHSFGEHAKPVPFHAQMNCKRQAETVQRV